MEQNKTDKKESRILFSLKDMAHCRKKCGVSRWENSSRISEQLAFKKTNDSIYHSIFSNDVMTAE